MAQNEKKSGVIKWLLIIVAVVLLLFICWKAGWILNGNKNQVSEQEQREALREAADELNSELQEANDELQEVGEGLQEVHDILK